MSEPTNFSIFAIGERLRTQDNRITDQPMFLVQERIGKRWNYVTACFTAVGAQDYIDRNGHNHRGKLRIYADGSFRNCEWRAVRDFLMGFEKKEAGKR